MCRCSSNGTRIHLQVTSQKRRDSATNYSINRVRIHVQVLPKWGEDSSVGAFQMGKKPHLQVFPRYSPNEIRTHLQVLPLLQALSPATFPTLLGTKIRFRISLVKRIGWFQHEAGDIPRNKCPHLSNAQGSCLVIVTVPTPVGRQSSSECRDRGSLNGRPLCAKRPLSNMNPGKCLPENYE